MKDLVRQLGEVTLRHSEKQYALTWLSAIRRMLKSLLTKSQSNLPPGPPAGNPLEHDTGDVGAHDDDYHHHDDHDDLV